MGHPQLHRNCGRHRKDAATALQQITAAALVIGLTSDILFPLSEQKYLATHIPNAKYAEIDSVYGHDGFLPEFEAIEREINQFIKNKIVAPNNDGVVQTQRSLQ